MGKELERLSECVRNSDDERALELIKQALIDKDTRIKELKDKNDILNNAYELRNTQKKALKSKLDKIKEVLIKSTELNHLMDYNIYDLISEILKESE